MLISWDIETAKPTPDGKCPGCGGYDFSEADANGVALEKDHLLCLGCQKIGSKYVDFKTDWLEFAPLGISCAGAARLEGGQSITKLWHGEEGAMTKDQCVSLVADLMKFQSNGHQIVTWNGASFDFQVLANETGMYKECAELAMNHVDLMFYVVASRGFRLGLEAALIGANLPPKLHEVTLSTGEVIKEMSGAMAPQLWLSGEQGAVLEYLEVDVAQTVLLASNINRTRAIRWTSKSGRSQKVSIPRGTKLPTVKDCLKWKVPYAGWMDSPPSREDFVGWALEALEND